MCPIPCECICVSISVTTIALRSLQRVCVWIFAQISCDVFFFLVGVVIVYIIAADLVLLAGIYYCICKRKNDCIEEDENNRQALVFLR